MKTDERVGDVVTTSQVENDLTEPCCGILDWLETLVVSERQVDQQTVAIIQPANHECRNKGMEGGRRYVREATDASQLTQGGKAARALSCTWVFIVRSWSMKTPRSRTVVPHNELNACWNSVYRRIFGFHKWESVKSFIDGLGRLDLKHLVMTYKVRFYKKLAYGANSVMSDLFYVHLMDTDYVAECICYRSYKNWLYKRL